VVSFRGDVDIDAWPDLRMRSRDAIERAFGLAVDVVGRESRVGNLVVTLLLEMYLFTALNPNKIRTSNMALDKSPRFV
jgi:hypothetical protein